MAKPNPEIMRSFTLTSVQSAAISKTLDLKCLAATATLRMVAQDELSHRYGRAGTYKPCLEIGAQNEETLQSTASFNSLGLMEKPAFHIVPLQAAAADKARFPDRTAITNIEFLRGFLVHEIPTQADYPFDPDTRGEEGLIVIGAGDDHTIEIGDIPRTLIISNGRLYTSTETVMALEKRLESSYSSDMVDATVQLCCD